MICDFILLYRAFCAVRWRMRDASSQARVELRLVLKKLRWKWSGR